MATGSNLCQAEPGVTKLEPEIPRPFSGSAAAGSQRVLSLAAALRCCTFRDFVQSLKQLDGSILIFDSEGAQGVIKSVCLLCI